MADRLADLRTPCLVLERGRMEHNIAAMAGRASALGVALRPHLKTCKSREIAALLAPGKRRVTVSTLEEAAYFAGDGFRDILYAVSIAPSAVRSASVEQQSQTLSSICDSAFNVPSGSRVA